MSEALFHLAWSGRLVAAAVAFLGVAWLARRRPWLAAAPGAFGGVVLAFGLTIPLMFVRPSPGAADRRLYEGVRYQRWVRSTPVRQVVHLLTIDLATEGLRVFVTPATATEAWDITARTTSGFLRAFDQQLAVNGNFFYEQSSRSIFFYYPQVGEPVNVVGRAVSRGRAYGRDDPSTWTLWFLEGRAEISREPRDAEAAVSGYPLLRAGEVPAGTRRSKRLLAPRLGAGVRADGRTLLLAMIDGRQPFYSDGATLLDLAAILEEAGAHDAIILDGGGSGTLVWRSPDGDVELLNRPVHGRMPSGYERPVANHIGFSGLRPAR